MIIVATAIIVANGDNSREATVTSENRQKSASFLTSLAESGTTGSCGIVI